MQPYNCFSCNHCLCTHLVLHAVAAFNSACAETQFTLQYSIGVASTDVPVALSLLPASLRVLYIHRTVARSLMVGHKQTAGIRSADQ